MIGRSFVVITILIAFSGYALGLHMSYPNESFVFFSVRENITLTCTGNEEVMWAVHCSHKGIYSMKEESPSRKIVQIKNATLFHAGDYACHSKKNTTEFVYIYLNPDDSVIESMGFDPRADSYVIPP
ncbi:uncharacterized protein LOC135834234 [Planococcus citri]|uniref:uncharacterized protein LOC135834234 n=1 Tax=Planococcus citri TaxID=170843 RepID=UPI0031F99188